MVYRLTSLTHLFLRFNRIRVVNDDIRYLKVISTLLHPPNADATAAAAAAAAAANICTYSDIDSLPSVL